MAKWRKELGDALRQFRKSKGWYQSDIEGKAGIQRQVVSDIENGKFVGAISTVERYMLLANVELKVITKADDFPQLDDLENLFGEESD